MPAQPASRKELKLPPFKEENPVAWFKQAEAYFRIHGETDRELWFFYVQWALTPLQEKLVQDIISTDHTPPNAYGLLKERLLQLYEKGERARCRKLVDLPPIGGRRPSEMLAEMSTMCPRGEQNSNLFRYMFYFRLPPRIQELLGEDDQSSVVELAARADTLTLNEAGKAKAVNGVEESMVAAAEAAPSGDSDDGGDSGDSGDSSDSDSDAWESSGMCYAHFMYGAQARSCKPPCSRAGN
jgi:hypothetical protein